VCAIFNFWSLVRFIFHLIWVKRKNSLDSNIKIFRIECLKKNLSHVFSVLRWIHWRFCQNERCIIRVTTQIVEDALVPKFFHKRPISDDTALHGILLNLLIECFIANAEIKLFVVIFTHLRAILRIGWDRKSIQH